MYTWYNTVLEINCDIAPTFSLRQPNVIGCPEKKHLIGINFWMLTVDKNMETDVNKTVDPIIVAAILER